MSVLKSPNMIDRYARDRRTGASATTVTPVQALPRLRDQPDRGSGGALRSSSRVVAATSPSSPDRGRAARPIASVTALAYRNPDELADGGVLVVGASATGVQLAEEIQRLGRPVTISVGEHVRMPRTYRGRDIFWWTDAAGVLDERYDEVDDIVRARHLPSPQLIGTPQRRSIDLNTLQDPGSGSSDGWAGYATVSPSSPDRCATRARSPTSR